MTPNAPERHRHNNQRHHHYARSPVRSYYGVARAASRYNALNVVGSTLARLSPVPLRTTAHPHSSTIPQNIPQKGGHLSRSKSARIKACRYDRLSPSAWRLGLLAQAHMMVIVRTELSESGAFEIAYNSVVT